MELDDSKWINEAVALAKAHFKAPVFFVEPVYRGDLKPPNVVVDLLSDDFEPNGRSFTRTFTITSTVVRGIDESSSRVSAAVKEMQDFMSYIGQVPPRAHLQGAPLFLESRIVLDPSEAESNLYIQLLTIRHDLSL